MKKLMFTFAGIISCVCLFTGCNTTEETNYNYYYGRESLPPTHVFHYKNQFKPAPAPVFKQNPDFQKHQNEFHHQPKKGPNPNKPMFKQPVNNKPEK